MLGKLIKYDIRGGIKYFRAMAVSLACTIIISFLISMLKISGLDSVFYVFSILLTVCCAIWYFIANFFRIYAQMCGNESYLTYMIPASIGKTLFSKFITALIWGIGVFAMLWLFWNIMMRFIFAQLDMRTGFLEIVGPYISHIIAMVLFLLLVSNTLILLSCAISCLPAIKNRNVGTGALIVIFYVLYQLSGVVLLCAWLIVTCLKGGSISTSYFDNPNNLIVIMNNLRDVTLGCAAVFAVSFFFISAHLFRSRHSI